MGRHLADHRSPSKGARALRFLGIERAGGDRLWRSLARRPRPVGKARVIQFLRIAREQPAE